MESKRKRKNYFNFSKFVVVVVIQRQFHKDAMPATTNKKITPNKIQ
jgi:hypothetical protein